MSVHGRSARSGRGQGSAFAAAAESAVGSRSNLLRESESQGDVGLTPEEASKCIQAFKAFDKDESDDIDVDELRIVLRMMGIEVTEVKLQRMMNEANPDNPTSINQAQFKRVIGKQRRFQNKTNEDDTLDAFVALGGNPDKTGEIDTRRLKDIIKSQFEMTIDIDNLIKDVDEDDSGKIDYYEFVKLLSFNNN